MRQRPSWLASSSAQWPCGQFLKKVKGSIVCFHATAFIFRYPTQHRVLFAKGDRLLVHSFLVLYTEPAQAFSSRFFNLLSSRSSPTYFNHCHLWCMLLWIQQPFAFQMNCLISISLLATTVIAQYSHQIPWVESVVHSCTSQFAPFVTYHGPTGTGYSFPGPRPTGTQQPIPSATAIPCSYWLEEIQHQGVAAFNPNASYQVFRNVIDYGAKGDGVTDDTGLSSSAFHRHVG